VSLLGRLGVTSDRFYGRGGVRRERNYRHLGNVSHHVPSICAYLEICGTEASWHSTAVADATITAKGHKAIVDGAVSMALTAIDFLFDDSARAAIKAEFEQTERYTGDV
jgi:hypothetical protein